jgi:hypothetical protein
MDTNSVALVRERTIPTERPPLVGEVSANFADRGMLQLNLKILNNLILLVLFNAIRKCNCLFVYLTFL